MLRATFIAVVAAAIAPGCVIDSSHVRTTLIEICAEDLPVLFRQDSPRVASASVMVEDVGAEIDAPDARAELQSIVLESRGDIEDFSFADSVRAELIAPSSMLPNVAVAEDLSVSGESPMIAPGDRSVNLVDYLLSDMLEVRIVIEGDIERSSFNTLFSACIDVEGIAIEDDNTTP